MPIALPSDFSEAMAVLERQGALPRLTNQQIAAIYRSLSKQAGFAADSALDTQLSKIKEILNSLVTPKEVIREGGAKVMEGFNQATARTSISKIMTDMGAGQLAQSGWVGFMLDVAQEVSAGAGRFVAMNSDDDRIDLYPALELQRFFDRTVPRGFKRLGKVIVPVPDEDWPTRWNAAGNEADDDDFTDSSSGRMVALKSSGIWQALGDGAGGYDDALGNPFPPFAFNSGFSVREVARADVEALGLLDPGEKAEGADFDFGNLFAAAA